MMTMITMMPMRMTMVSITYDLVRWKTRCSATSITCARPMVHWSQNFARFETNLLGFSAGAELICVSTITPLFRMALCTTSLESLATTHRGFVSCSTIIAILSRPLVPLPYHCAVDFDLLNSFGLCRVGDWNWNWCSAFLTRTLLPSPTHQSRTSSRCTQYQQCAQIYIVPLVLKS